MNKEYIKLMFFVVVLGFITSLLFVAMDLLFAERIEMNQNQKLYEVILSNNDIEYTEDTLFDVYEEHIEEQVFIHNDMEVTMYIYEDSNTVSYKFGIFTASGYINDIVGILTVTNDFSKVIDIDILEQAETPGLGGKVVLRDFLDQFIGLEFESDTYDAVLIGPIGRDNSFNEVDQIAGATNTSNAMQELLNESYEIYKGLWVGE